MPVPVTVAAADARAPRFVGPRRSCSRCRSRGDTEETLSRRAAPRDRGATVVVRLATAASWPRLVGEHGGTVVPGAPGDRVLPRAAIGAMAVAACSCSSSASGCSPGRGGWLTESAVTLAVRRDQPARGRRAGNPARELARRIGRTIPLVYGGGGSAAGGPAVEERGQRERQGARRSGTQYPSLDHNEICGWGQHGDVTRQVFTLVELRHDHEHPQIERRFVATAGHRGDRPPGLEVRAAGRGPPRPAARPRVLRRPGSASTWPPTRASTPVPSTLEESSRLALGSRTLGCHERTSWPSLTSASIVPRHETPALTTSRSPTCPSPTSAARRSTSPSTRCPGSWPCAPSTGRRSRSPAPASPARCT